MEKKPVKVEKERDYTKPYSRTYHYTKERKGRSAKPSVAGVLLILIGVLGIVIAMVLGAAGVLLYSFGPEIDISCSLLGRVTDPQGLPIEGATVSVVDEDLSASTDENGYFALMNIKVGFVEVRIHHSGFVIQQNTYFLRDNGNINLSQFEEEKEEWLDDQFWENDFWNDDDYQGYDDDYYDDENYEGLEEFEKNHNFYLIRLNQGSGLDESDMSGIHDTGNLLLVCTICIGGVLISSLITLGGGILAVMRKGYGMAILGCVTGIFTLAFPLNLIFCVIAFFLLVLSYDEFQPGKKKRPYKGKKRTVTWKGYKTRKEER